MGRIVTVRSLVPQVKKLKRQGKKIVVAGGCFDVLHPGHVVFLEKAKQAGDYLVVLLESDEKVKSLKGLKRPVHTQQMRAQILAALTSVDFVLLLPFMSSTQSYDQLIQKLQPDVIAMTRGYTSVNHHERTAKIAGARIRFVTGMIGNHSTSRILGD